MDELRDCPIWWDGKDVVEAVFCEEFMDCHQITYDENAFFTPEGRMTDELPLRRAIYNALKDYAVKNIPHSINNIVELLKFYDTGIDLAPQQDRIHLANGTLFTDGTFAQGKQEIVRNRLPIPYNPNAPQPENWLRFLRSSSPDLPETPAIRQSTSKSLQATALVFWMLRTASTLLLSQVK